MTQVPTPDPAAAPAIPPKFRTIAYVTGLCLSGSGAMAINITAVVAPSSALLVAGVVGAVLSAVGLVSNGLGVAYRPTAASGGR